MKQISLSGEVRGQWVVAVRDIPSNTEELLGPYHSELKAWDIEAVGAAHIAEAVVRHVRPGSIDFDELRDELLRDLEEMGYTVSNQDTRDA